MRFKPSARSGFRVRRVVDPILGLPARNMRGTGSVEAIGVVLLVALMVVAMGAFLVLKREQAPGRGIGHRIANRIACGPRAGEPCRRHPLVPAYGWPLARAVRMLAPPVEAEGGLVPVDFRYCQRPTCATPTGSRPGLTTANRRATYFTQVRPDEQGGHEVTYWLYRPSTGWTSHQFSVGPAEIEAASGVRLLLKDDPRLVPLEILPGRNHYRLPAGDEPPWQWGVRPRFPGRSA